MLELRSKPDAAEALERMERWWLRENDERALLTIGIDFEWRPETKTYATHRDRWLDFDYRIERALGDVDRRTYIAETFPVFEPTLGPDILSTVYGLPLEFQDGTTWGSPTLASVGEVLDMQPDFGAELWQSVERLQRMALEAGNCRWITLFTDLHPNIDILSALVGPEPLCMEVADDPDLVQRAVMHVAPTCAEAYRRQVRPLLEADLPVGCWMQAFSARTTHVPQCDFSALIGPRFFEEAILPAIRIEMAEADRNIYHLDGPDALRHLDVLLEVPEIDAIQWVYGEGNGPARRWQHVYKKILAAGKGIRVEAADIDDISCLNEALGPNGVWYVANFSAPDEVTAGRLLATLESH